MSKVGKAAPSQRYTTRVRLSFIPAACFMLLCLTQPVIAAITTTGSVTPYSDPNTWSLDTYAYIGYSGDGSISVTDGSDVKSSYCQIAYDPNSTASITVDGNGSSWISRRIFFVGGHGDGTLRIINGGKVGDDVSGPSSEIGHGEGSKGYVTVDGNGSTWRTLTGISVGYKGDGTLEITNGGFVSNSSTFTGLGTNSTSQLIVDGVGSTLACSRSVSIGYLSKNSTLSITNGGTVSGLEEAAIGILNGSIASVIVDGVGSNWTNGGRMIVGNHGKGSLTITNGGLVSNTYSIIGHEDANAEGTVTVDGKNSKWVNSGHFYIGYRGRATLSITNGGTVVSNNHCAIGLSPHSSSNVNVEGSGTNWTHYGDLEARQNVLLSISNGGLVSIAGTLTIGFNADQYVDLSTGGMLALKGQADDSITSFLDLVGGSDEIRFWDDSIGDWSHIANATYGEDYTLDYITEGDLAGYTLLTVGKISPLLVEIDVKPGSDVNPINLKSGGVIPVAILTTETFDATTVDINTIELSGAAVAVRGNGKHIMAEQTDVDGDGDIDLLVHIETQQLVIDPGTTIVTLTGETFDGTKIEGTDDIKLVGDLNGDGTVDLVDLNIILIQWGKKGAAITDLRADTNLNGDVGLEDLNAVLIDWGK